MIISDADRDQRIWLLYMVLYVSINWELRPENNIHESFKKKGKMKFTTLASLF